MISTIHPLRIENLPVLDTPVAVSLPAEGNMQLNSMVEIILDTTAHKRQHLNDNGFTTRWP